MQAAVENVKEALKGNDSEAIKKAADELQKPLYELSAAAYQQAQTQAAGAGADAGAAGPQAESSEEPKKEDENVVDAEYTEVKDDKK